MKRRLFLAAAAMLPAAAAHADAYPSKTIRVVLPGPPGGLLDVAARSLSDAMQRELGQTWLIDPRPGANGILAAQLVLGAPADGYTLYLTVSGHVVLNLLMRAPFDAMADFRPIAMVGVSSALICVPPASPANTIAEFVALARANPGKLNYLNPGNGTSAHLIPEQLRIKYGIDITSIEWRSATRLHLAGLRGHETVVANYDLADGRLVEIWCSTELTSGEWVPTAFPVGETGTLLVAESWSRAPLLAKVDENGLREIASLAAPQAEAAMKNRGVIEPFAWTAPDGMEIDGWLLCFRQAWAEIVTDPEITRVVLPQVEHLAQHMRNRHDPPG